MNIIFLCKRQYTGKDVIDDQYGRLFKIPHELSKLGNHLFCYSLSYKKRGDASYQIRENLHWTSTDFKLINIFSLKKFIATIINQVKTKNIDVIYTSSDVLHLGIGSYISSITGKPLVTDLYDNFESFGLTKLPFMRSIYSLALRKSHAITCVSEPLSKHIRQYCSDDCELLTIENAVEHAVFKPLPMPDCRRKFSLPEKAVLIGTAGALYESRDIATLFNSFNILHKERQDIHLVLAGRISGKVKIPDIDRVHYLGQLDHYDVASFYNALDVAVVPLTSSEFGKYCFPQKASEILACKRPVVASSVGVMKEILSGYPECLFDDGDAKMLAEKILLQLKRCVVPDIHVPGWADQAEKIMRLFSDVCNDEPRLS